MRGVVWVGSSLADLKAFPPDVQDVMGYALYLAQAGGKHPRAHPLRGFVGASVLEAIDDFDGDTYRCVYTVHFPSAIFVLHAFQKKSKQGRAIPRRDVELIRQRLAKAISLATVQVPPRRAREATIKQGDKQ